MCIRCFTWACECAQSLFPELPHHLLTPLGAAACIMLSLISVLCMFAYLVYLPVAYTLLGGFRLHATVAEAFVVLCCSAAGLRGFGMQPAKGCFVTVFCTLHIVHQHGACEQQTPCYSQGLLPCDSNAQQCCRLLCMFGLDCAPHVCRCMRTNWALCLVDANDYAYGSAVMLLYSMRIVCTNMMMLPTAGG
jgi:hypothetical protein